MKTTFAEPSNTYTIVLNNHDIAKLITGGVLFRPGYSQSRHYQGSNEVTDGEGHHLLYLLPGEGLNGASIPIQFVTIQLKQEDL